MKLRENGPAACMKNPTLLRRIVHRLGGSMKVSTSSKSARDYSIREGLTGLGGIINNECVNTNEDIQPVPFYLENAFRKIARDKKNSLKVVWDVARGIVQKQIEMFAQYGIAGGDEELIIYDRDLRHRFGLSDYR